MAIKRGKVKAKAKSEGSKELLLENFVLLQKTLVETAAALREVDRKIGSLLNLFEDASRKFKEGKPMGGDVSARLRVIEGQNQVIAKTLLLLQKSIKEKEKYGISNPLLETEEEAEERQTRKKAKKKKKPEEEGEEEGGESLFEEEFGEGEKEEKPSEEEEGYRPKPLPEFSF